MTFNYYLLSLIFKNLSSSIGILPPKSNYLETVKEEQINMAKSEKSPKLQLCDEERVILRKNKVKLVHLKHYKKEELVQLGFHENRAKELIALSIFQAIPSVGPNLASNVVNDLGYYSLEEIRHQKGEELVLTLEKKYGVWMDPCVEDVLRCVVYHANNPGSDKNWWEFTEERKEYRKRFGYPVDRPTKAWNE